MSCTFWNLRRKKAALAREQAKRIAAEKEAAKVAKPSAKKGGAKNGNE